MIISVPVKTKLFVSFSSYTPKNNAIFDDDQSFKLVLTNPLPNVVNKVNKLLDRLHKQKTLQPDEVN